MLSWSALKLIAGACFYDLPSFAWYLLPGRKRQWTFFCNRDERLLYDEQRIGAQCEWRWTSDLHVAKVFPCLGIHLMKRSLCDWPINLKQEMPQDSSNIQVSFIIGHRGAARLPHLLTTLKSIAAQRCCSFECIVVEQAKVPEIADLLPGWVRYAYTPLPYADMPYNRSWAFNVGAAMAEGKILILHDNDMLLPRDYAAQIIARHNDGYEVINPKRFIFYLNKEHSNKIMSSGDLSLDRQPESIVQNLEAGGSFAITREAFIAVGGFDESFVGWGGEDNEFWERAQTRAVWPYGYMPVVHLWHEAQPGKFNHARDTVDLYESRSVIPVEERIEELKKRNFLSLSTS